MNSHVEALRSLLIKAVKAQLREPLIEDVCPEYLTVLDATNPPVFEKPKTHGIYRHTGELLGEVGGVYVPPDLNLFLDLIVQSIEQCANWLDLDKLEYIELKGGSKIRISVPGPTLEVKTRMVGDAIATRLDFITGFDGLTKTSLGHFTKRLWCGNGAARWDKDVALSFKNTPGNQGKWPLFCDEIGAALGNLEVHIQLLNEAVKVTYTAAMRNRFITEVFGFSDADTELTTRKQNILGKVNACIAIEEANTGTNLFGLLQGVTRYTSHEMAAGDMDSLMIDTAAKINKAAHKAISDIIG
jgi:hypothetical protein